ncbi:putative transposase [Xanthomonas oryzae pv. oryzae KACC 10331]|uniref:Transposase n=1 Tax=Xanthomonas oryzae pv. oryzae (strain KACC10331 / KXO85) TaxID=291331 RepID=Q5GUD4_XANOR|nr:putative transposase [Xanthomonas oryzae pv. oryzae KACC 10331]
MIVDAQSVKNSDTAGQKGYDAGKKVSGIKRHIAVDTQGFPHAVAVTTAEVTDRQGALEALKRCRSGLGSGETPAVRQRLHRRSLRRGRTGHSGQACHRTDCQAQRAAYLQGHAQALGVSNAALPGWRRTGGYGRTASEGSIPACSPSTWRSWHCYSGDREQILSHLPHRFSSRAAKRSVARA